MIVRHNEMGDLGDKFIIDPAGKAIAQVRGGHLVKLAAGYTVKKVRPGDIRAVERAAKIGPIPTVSGEWNYGTDASYTVGQLPGRRRGWQKYGARARFVPPGQAKWWKQPRLGATGMKPLLPGSESATAQRQELFGDDNLFGLGRGVMMPGAEGAVTEDSGDIFDLEYDGEESSNLF